MRRRRPIMHIAVCAACRHRITSHVKLRCLLCDKQDKCRALLAYVPQRPGEVIK